MRSNTFFSIFLVALSLQCGLSLSTVYNENGASVQLFEWSWADVAAECESFLAPKGFKAVQVSPPTEHIKGSEWWTRYQPVTYNLISRSGNETQFIDMVNRCNKVNVAIVVDAVINHMAAGSGVGIAGSSYGSRQYPFYSPNDFHHNTNDIYTNCQVTNYYDKHNVQYCDLVGLPDLMTSSDYVQSQIAGYINKVASYGVKGIRVDAAKHQDATELAGILKRLPAGFYVGQEVIGSTGEAVQPSMYYSNGQVSEFYYADDLDVNIINENKMIYLQTFGESWGLMPVQYAAVFLDNHDTQRNGRAMLTYKNGDLYRFANIFMLAWPYGNARVMSSYYFTNTDAGPPSVGVEGGKRCTDGVNWVCEHRWPAIANMVNWRNTVGSTPVSNWQVGTANQIAFSRGGLGFLSMNRSPSSQWTATLQTGLPEGTYCNVAKADELYADDVSKCSEKVHVDASGKASIVVPAIGAVALHANAKL